MMNTVIPKVLLAQTQEGQITKCHLNKTIYQGDGGIAQWIAFLLPTQRPRVGFMVFPKIYFLYKFINWMLLRFIYSKLLREWTEQSLIS